MEKKKSKNRKKKKKKKRERAMTVLELMHKESLSRYSPPGEVSRWEMRTGSAQRRRLAGISADAQCSSLGRGSATGAIPLLFLAEPVEPAAPVPRRVGVRSPIQAPEWISD